MSLGSSQSESKVSLEVRMKQMMRGTGVHELLMVVSVDARDIVDITPLIKDNEQLFRIKFKKSNSGYTSGGGLLGEYKDVTRSWLVSLCDDSLTRNTKRDKPREAIIASVEWIHDEIDKHKDSFYESEQGRYNKALILESTPQADQYGTVVNGEVHTKGVCFITERNNVMYSCDIQCERLYITAKDVVLGGAIKWDIAPRYRSMTHRFICETIEFDYCSAFLDWCYYMNHKTLKAHKVVINEQLRENHMTDMIEALLMVALQRTNGGLQGNIVVGQINIVEPLEHIELNIENNKKVRDKLFKYINKVINKENFPRKLRSSWKNTTESDEITHGIVARNIYWSSFKQAYSYYLGIDADETGGTVIYNRDLESYYNWLAEISQLWFLIVICDNIGWDDKRYLGLINNILTDLDFPLSTMKSRVGYIKDYDEKSNKTFMEIKGTFYKADLRIEDIWTGIVKELKNHLESIKKCMERGK